MELGVADLLVGLEGDVAADHVVEEDAQGPDGGLGAQVARTPDPLGRGVDPGALELRVVVILHEGPAPEVDEIQLSSFEIDEDVFILDVPVDDARGVAGEDCLYNLAEEVGSNLLIEAALLTDVVEHVNTVTGVFHNVDEGVVSLEEVQYFHHSVHFSDCAQKFELQGDLFAVELQLMRNEIQSCYHLISVIIQLTKSHSVILFFATCLMAIVTPSLSLTPL